MNMTLLVIRSVSSQIIDLIMLVTSTAFVLLYAPMRNAVRGLLRMEK